MKFKSQIATTREQSEQLLALGLRLDTADCHIGMAPNGMDYTYITRNNHEIASNIIPAWSLSRLLELMPGMINENGMKDYQLNIYGKFLSYSHFVNERHMGDLVFINHLGNIFDGVISLISWLISKGYFNKNYLK